MPSILIVDDDLTFCQMLDSFFKRKGFETRVAYTFKSGLSHFKSFTPDVLITDIRLPDREGLGFLPEIRKSVSPCPVIVMTGYGDIRTAVNSIKQGAFDYVTKPVNPDEILHTVRQSLVAANNGKDQILRSRVVGDSHVSRKMEEYIKLVAPTNMSVVLSGESGTGKEWAARAIHQGSRRAEMPFVAIDCGALPNELAASELFGHMKGAFTGAIADKRGCFAQASGGTLFLDEIGNLTYDVQVKLLRALQEREYRPLGGEKAEDTDVRIVVATNENLKDLVQRGEFREDLFHRINEFVIEVPPLRERKEDILVFARHFLDNARKELDRQVEGFDLEAQKALLSYSWPGNIRELNNVVKRATLLTKGGWVSRDVLPPEILFPEVNNSTDHASGDDLRVHRDKVEYQRIVAVLEKARYNKTKAAEMLNIDRKTLYKKMRQFNIEL